MKYLGLFLTSILLISIFLIGCEDFTELQAPVIDTGDVDFTFYVAIGNSITAGYQNNSLYQSAQRYSYPALIARQAGVENFEQPYLEDPGIPNRMRVGSLSPFSISIDSMHIAPLNAQLPRPYNNLGIPGAILVDAIDTTDFALKAGDPRRNPFFSLILRSSAFGKSVMEQALSLNPDIITFWLGNNDILAYVTSGGATRLPTEQNPAVFNAILNQTAAALAASGAKVVMANIPDVTVIPFVNTVPPVIINPATGQPVLDPNGNPIFYIGVNPGDKVLLTALALINQGFGIPTALGGNNQPLPGQVVLTAEEQIHAGETISQFNTFIAQAAETFGFELVDVNAKLNQIKENKYPLGSTELTVDFITGGIFSLDGVHPTNWGHGIIANEFIKVINSKFGANIPEVTIGALPPSIEFAAKASFTTADLFKMDTNVFDDVVKMLTSY